MTGGGSDDASDHESQGDQQQTSTTGWAELTVGALGGLVVTLLLLFLGYQALAVRDEPVRLQAAVVAVDASPGQYVVHFDVVNHGGETAEAVHVVGELVDAGAVVERVSSTVDYVPPGSGRRGALVFTRDPSEHPLQLRASSYNLP